RVDRQARSGPGARPRLRIRARGSASASAARPGLRAARAVECSRASPARAQSTIASPRQLELQLARERRCELTHQARLAGEEPFRVIAIGQLVELVIEVMTKLV